ncbi:hypothetical protein KEM55_005947, partial [Ascosphaera atra]
MSSTGSKPTVTTGAGAGAGTVPSEYIATTYQASCSRCHTPLNLDSGQGYVQFGMNSYYCSR